MSTFIATKASSTNNTISQSKSTRSMSPQRGTGSSSSTYVNRSAFTSSSSSSVGIVVGGGGPRKSGPSAPTNTSSKAGTSITNPPPIGASFANPPSNPPPASSVKQSTVDASFTSSGGSAGGSRRGGGGNRHSAPPGMDLVVGEELDRMLCSEDKHHQAHHQQQQQERGGGATEERDSFTTTACSQASGAQQRGRPSESSSRKGGASSDSCSPIGLSPHGLAPHGLPTYTEPTTTTGNSNVGITATASPGSNFPSNPQRVPSPPTPSRRAKVVSSTVRKLQTAKDNADAQSNMLEAAEEEGSGSSNNNTTGVSTVAVENGAVGEAGGFTSSSENSFCSSGTFDSKGVFIPGVHSKGHKRPGYRCTKCSKPPVAGPIHIPLLKRLSGVEAAVAYGNTPEGREALLRRRNNNNGSPPPQLQSTLDSNSNTQGSLQVGFIAPGVFKREQQVAVALVERTKRREWLEAMELESTMNRNTHRVGLHMMASEAYRWNKARRQQRPSMPFVPMPPQFMRGLRHDFNLLLGPAQEKDRYHAALQATIALRMWNPPVPQVPRPNLTVLSKSVSRNSSSASLATVSSSRNKAGPSSGGHSKAPGSRPQSKGR